MCVCVCVNTVRVVDIEIPFTIGLWRGGGVGEGGTNSAILLTKYAYAL